MTRQWLAHPDYMCISHITGEHAETHSFIAKMRKGYSLEGFYEGGMLYGAEYVVARHELLSQFLKGHSTPLYVEDDIARLSREYPLNPPTIEHVRNSIITLINRCENCYAKHGNFVKH